MTVEVPMSARERRRRITGLLAEEGRLSVAELAERFGVTDVSIRRDLVALEDEGELRRVHGGAVPTGVRGRNGTYARQARQNHELKARIGALSATLVRRGDIVTFDSGSTVAQVATHLPAVLQRGSAITAVTNSLPVIREISSWDAPHLVCLGGLYLPEHEALVGPQTIADMRDLSADLVFIGCDGLTPEAGLTTQHVLVAEVGATMASQARRVVVVADSTKLGRRGFTPIVPLSAAHVLVTDDGADPEVLRAVRDAGLDVLLA
jgi:DeoR/GlpR family transcriptional regulator of sugar metabolism